MSSSTPFKHTVTEVAPDSASIGDEYYNPVTNELFKRIVHDAKTVKWVKLGDAVTFGSGDPILRQKGSVLQIVSSTLTTSTSSTSTTDVSVGLSATITPTNVKNKILIMYNLQGSTTNSFNATIYRGTVAICTGTSVATRTATSSFIPSGATNAAVVTQSQHYFDSPATTLAITYDIRCNTDSGTFYVNRRGTDTFISTTSTITLMEIAV